jgi:hypothetical protein
MHWTWETEVLHPLLSPSEQKSAQLAYAVGNREQESY